MRAPLARPAARMAAVVSSILLLTAATLAHAADPPPSSPPTSFPGSVKDSPGYVPLHDPDSLADELGRRTDAPRVKMEFHGGARSLEELGRQVCGALHSGRPDSLLGLCVRSDEFRVIMWPEFPQSRPATGLRWDDAWPIVWGHLNGGSVAAVRENLDHAWTFIRIEESSVVPYRNFKLHNGITLTAKNDVGEVHHFTWIRSVVERKGRFKIAAMRD
jgi:hypothetical protein